MRRAAEAAFVVPLKMDLEELRQSLRPERVTQSNLPGDLVHDWTAPDGRARVEVAPKGDPNNDETLRRFARAVLAVQPHATGQAIATYEWGQTIVTAFMQAGAWALCSITILLWIVLRRVRDVMSTLIPLIVAAAVTLEICALTGFSLNYANIIALPVLLNTSDVDIIFAFLLMSMRIRRMTSLARLPSTMMPLSASPTSSRSGG